MYVQCIRYDNLKLQAHAFMTVRRNGRRDDSIQWDRAFSQNGKSQNRKMSEQKTGKSQNGFYPNSLSSKTGKCQNGKCQKGICPN